MQSDNPISAEAVRSGNRRALSKAITLIESSNAIDADAAQELLSEIMPHTGGSFRIGVSGVPGVGKSTFIESLGMLLISRGLRVAVLAVDPSSPFSGGSILGDKTRMEKLSASDQAFIRPSPTAGSLGGVTRRTRETILLCEAAGYDVILVETVGVGQSEYEVASMTDFFLLLMLPGAGDALQGIKRGILELAHMLVVNKSDGDNKERAKQAMQDIRQGLHYLMPQDEAFPVEVMACSALTNEGVEAVWNHVEKVLLELRSTGRLDSNRRKQTLGWVKSLIEQRVLDRFWNDGNVQADYMKAISELRSGSMSPIQAVELVMNSYSDNFRG